jgi:hypothetical protein
LRLFNCHPHEFIILLTKHMPAGAILTFASAAVHVKSEFRIDSH